MPVLRPKGIHAMLSPPPAALFDAMPSLKVTTTTSSSTFLLWDLHKPDPLSMAVHDKVLLNDGENSRELPGLGLPELNVAGQTFRAFPTRQFTHSSWVDRSCRSLQPLSPRHVGGSGRPAHINPVAQ
jgi:hypothetical protein